MGWHPIGWPSPPGTTTGITPLLRAPNYAFSLSGVPPEEGLQKTCKRNAYRMQLYRMRLQHDSVVGQAAVSLHLPPAPQHVATQVSQFSRERLAMAWCACSGPLCMLERTQGRSLFPYMHACKLQVCCHACGPTNRGDGRQWPATRHPQCQ